MQTETATNAEMTKYIAKHHFEDLFEKLLKLWLQKHESIDARIKVELK